MRWSPPVLLLLAVLSGCAGPNPAPAEELQLAAQLRALRTRIERLQARAAGATTPAPLAEPRRPKPEPGDAPRDTNELETTLRLRRDETQELETAAAWLADLPPAKARDVVRRNWSGVTNQAHTIKILVHMKRAAAEAVLGGMTPRVLRFRDGTHYVEAHSPEHPAADRAGYVRIRLVRDAR